MKSTGYRKEKIVRILGEVEGGRSVAETAGQYAVPECTIHRWRKCSGGIQLSEAKRLRELEAGNTRLQGIVGDQALDIGGLKELLRGEW